MHVCTSTYFVLLFEISLHSALFSMAHLCAQCQVFAQLWDVEAEHSLYRFCEFLYRSAHTLGEDDPQREGGLSALFTSTCVPETGWVVVGGWDQMRSKG